MQILELVESIILVYLFVDGLVNISLLNPLEFIIIVIILCIII